MFRNLPKNLAVSMLLSLSLFTSSAEHALKIKDEIVHVKKDDDPKDKKMVFEFPKLKGEYGVGVTGRHIIDQNRKESHNPDLQRELMVQFWYPSQVDKNSLTIYRKDEIEETKAGLKHAGYPEKDVENLDKIYSHAISNAPVNKQNAPYPIILISHGYLGCGPQVYTAFCEELASHGYIVASIAHTYFAPSVKFPDGRDIRTALEKYTQKKIPAQDLNFWVEDVKCVLDSLAEINKNKNDQFYQNFDMSKVGMIGHSFGGVTAFELCLNDPRVKAGINLDGFIAGDTQANDLKKPFLFMLAQGSIDHGESMTDEEVVQRYGVDIEQQRENRKNFEKISKNLKETDLIKRVIIKDIQHMGFSDNLILKELPLYKNNKNLCDLDAIVGVAEGYKTINLINEHIVNFFSKYLK